MATGIAGDLFLKDGGGNRLLGELLLIWRLKDGGGNHCEFFWVRWGINVLDVQVEGWRRE